MTLFTISLAMCFLSLFAALGCAIGYAMERAIEARIGLDIYPPRKPYDWRGK